MLKSVYGIRQSPGHTWHNAPMFNLSRSMLVVRTRRCPGCSYYIQVLLRCLLKSWCQICVGPLPITIYWNSRRWYDGIFLSRCSHHNIVRHTSSCWQVVDLIVIGLFLTGSGDGVHCTARLLVSDNGLSPSGWQPHCLNQRWHSLLTHILRISASMSKGRWPRPSSWRRDYIAIVFVFTVYCVLGTSLLLWIYAPIYSYYCPYKHYLLPMCFKCLYILPLYILCIYSFMYWKSGTSDLWC